SLDHLQGVRLHIGKNKQEPILRGGQGTVLVHGKLAGGPGFPIEAPRRHMRLERRLARGNQLLKLVEGQARQIQECGWACLHIGELDSGHTSCLLSWEAQYTINRDKLNYFHELGATKLACLWVLEHLGNTKRR